MHSVDDSRSDMQGIPVQFVDHAPAGYTHDSYQHVPMVMPVPLQMCYYFGILPSL